MTLLTIFSTPKPFTDDHIAIIQRNALRSWLMLGVEVEVILVGDEPGLAETARELGVRHLAEVARNEQGTPLVSSIFALARANSDSPLLAYVNADILLLPDFLETAQKMMQLAARFLLVGQRWDLDVRELIDFSDGWLQRLDQYIKTEGKIHPPAGSDFFIFPRACFESIPDFAIGRAGWDNWMIYQARRQGWLTVDVTGEITIVHQQHDYAHLPGGQSHRHLPETEENIRLAGGREITRFSLLDVDHSLRSGKIAGRNWRQGSLRRMIETFPLLVWNNYSLTARVTSVFHRLKYIFRSREESS